jgi:hypothetical protein
MRSVEAGWLNQLPVSPVRQGSKWLFERGASAWEIWQLFTRPRRLDCRVAPVPASRCTVIYPPRRQEPKFGWTTGLRWHERAVLSGLTGW